MYIRVTNYFMKTSYFILALVFVQLAIACNSQQKKVVIVSDVSYEEKEQPEPPPPSFSCASSFTLKEYFLKICTTEKPKKDSIAFNFMFWDSENCYAIGLNPSEESTAKKDNAPFSKYYSLSKNEYKNLAWNQVLNKIKSQLKEFSKTKEFENSSLSKAKTITIKFDDGDLISLK